MITPDKKYFILVLNWFHDGFSAHLQVHCSKPFTILIIVLMNCDGLKLTLHYI